jgi:hypothetical protein
VVVTFVVSVSSPPPAQAAGSLVGVVPLSVQLAIACAAWPRTLGIVRTVAPSESWTAIVVPAAS